MLKVQKLYPESFLLLRQFKSPTKTIFLGSNNGDDRLDFDVEKRKKMYAMIKKKYLSKIYNLNNFNFKNMD